MNKGKIIDIIIGAAIIVACIAALIAFGYFNYWVISNPNIPDWFKYGLLFGRK